ncbi:MAG: TRAP transporter small permease [Gemmiger sp.]
MIQKFNKFEAVLAKIQSVFFCAVLAFMAIVMFVAVIRRYVLNDPLMWSEELTTVMQGALAFAGIGYCFHYKAHTRVLILHDRLPKPARVVCDLLCDGVMIYCLYKFCETMPKYIKSKNAYLTTLRWLNYSVFNYIIYAGFILAILYILVDAVRTIVTAVRPDLAQESAESN